MVVYKRINDKKKKYKFTKKIVKKIWSQFVVFFAKKNVEFLVKKQQISGLYAYDILSMRFESQFLL